MKIKRESVDVAGVSASYLTAGDKGPIVLLLHGTYWSRVWAPGVDGRTWQSYKQNLEVNLAELHSRIHRGTYRALPSRRRYIPKPDGRQRPLGIAALEDKIVQRAVVEVLNRCPLESGDRSSSLSTPTEVLGQAVACLPQR